MTPTEPPRSGSPVASPRSQRLVEVDALRGLAAIAVVLFHYTTHFVTVFAPRSGPSFGIPWGYLGVNQFFIISGFVIFMTLERTKQPMDFVVSRFSRLFPAYWLAIVLTFAITHVLGLPQKSVNLPAAVANVVMIHGLFGVPHVDGVYWTLEVELLFYIGMFTLYRLGQLSHITLALNAMLALRLAYYLGQVWLGIDLLPWRVYRVLILQYLPWFAMGISIYLWQHHRAADARRRAVVTAIAAVATLSITESAAIGMLGIGLSTLVLLAASGEAPVLRWRALVWLGGISYPLYLLHENIGWSVLLQLHARDLSPDMSLAITLLLSLVMADIVHRLVELPAMRWIRLRYRAHKGTVQPIAE